MRPTSSLQAAGHAQPRRGDIPRAARRRPTRRLELIERAPGPLHARADPGHRGAGIRTRDLLLPKQARYRTAPRPVDCAGQDTLIGNLCGALAPAVKCGAGPTVWALRYRAPGLAEPY